MRALLKIVLILSLGCICLAAMGQEKAFIAAMKNGKESDGFYRADLSKSSIKIDKLTEFAFKKGYLLREPRVGIGKNEKYVAVVSFLPYGELSPKEAAENGLSTGSGTTYHVDPKMQMMAGWLFKDISENRGQEVVTFHKRNSEYYDAETLRQLGRLCGYVFCGYRFNEMSYMTRQSLEARMHKQLCPSEPLTQSIGKGYLYPTNERGGDGHFQWFDNIRWTGNTTPKGNLDGFGFAYHEDGFQYHAALGEFKDGKPTGKISFYSFELVQLLSAQLPGSTVARIHPFEGNVAQCDWYDGRVVSSTSYINERFDFAARNPKDIWIGVLNNTRYGDYEEPKVVKGYENGYMTLAQHNPKLDMDVEYLVDSNGKIARVTDKTQAAIDAILDEMVSQYDNYLSKVLNPRDASNPIAALKKLGYDLASFPQEQYMQIVGPEDLKKAINDYNRRNPSRADKVELSSFVFRLFDAARRTLDLDKKAEEDFWAQRAKTADTKVMTTGFWGIRTGERQAYASDYFDKDRIAKAKDRLSFYFDNIERNPARPADFAVTKEATYLAYGEMEDWWSRVYHNFFDVFTARSEGLHRAEMCENCKIDGRRTTFPKGYVEGYTFLFISTPAESETNGILSLKNGEEVTWKYVYDDPMIIIDYMGKYSGRIRGRSKKEVVAKLVDEIITECNKRWGDR